MTTINATLNFVYFTMNFKYDFIEEVWDGSIARHLRDKFDKLYQKRSNFMDWFCELDRDNQRKLLEWVENNYTAFNHLKS